MKRFMGIIWEWLFTLSSLVMLIIFCLGFDRFGKYWLLAFLIIIPLFFISKMKHDDREYDEFLGALDRLDDNMPYTIKSEIRNIIKIYLKKG